jgi:hypothetical protein
MLTGAMREAVDALLEQVEPLDFEAVAARVEARRRAIGRDVAFGAQAVAALARLLHLALEAEREYGAVTPEALTPTQAGYLEIARRFRALLDEFKGFAVGETRIGHKLVRLTVARANDTAAVRGS